MKNKFIETLKFIEDKRTENLQKLINLSNDKLDDLKKYYYDWFKGAEESGYKESTIVNLKHYNLIEEAIKIKQWNDEQKKINRRKKIIISHVF
ncbi:MAG: hypothetical protein HY840_06905 [Bacteroidetes bacterium]|nr:hypothetical protein [Bacteroidota bacterium]